MNERIQELAFECARQLNWNPPSDPKEYTFSSAGLEKFAELIVRECIGALNKRFMGDLNREDMEVRRCIDDVKKHFGVEE